jgi:superfamily II DNA or RNA helicase
MSSSPPTAPAEFVQHLRFAKPWRPYQQRAIDEFDKHLADRHFHLVAAPGSGKTVMGLEVVRRLARPALVLAPTLAIREQWVRRLIDDFLPAGFDEIFWLSRNISKPRELTVTTYQSLGAEFRRDSGKALISKLRELGVSVLVVDEAHHLRAFWWKCLHALKKGLGKEAHGIDVVALTATPPVDVPQAEWNRYSTFCGPIDEEVGVPELVAEGNLCPHQDFVHFSLPTCNEVDTLHEFERGVHQLILDLQLDTDFAARLSAFPNWLPENPKRDYLRNQQDFYLALAIFLICTAGRVPEEIRRVYPITGIELPDLDPQWMQSLLQGLLFDFRPLLDDICDRHLQDDLKRWEKRTRSIGGVEKGRVVLVNVSENEKILRHSPAKIDSVAAIIEHENAALSLSLRAVILTDYIRREAFTRAAATALLSDAPAEKLGVVPIFERLRRMALTDVFPAVLTGSLIVIPSEAEEALRCTLRTKGASSLNITTKPLAHAPAFVEVSVRENDRQKAVEAITELFRCGEINCLVGTASLLGEGWDAPTLNTLVLASVVGSFVMSNQMRGRAIRIDPEDPDKAANIWHLATLQPRFATGTPLAGSAEIGGDFDTLRRRFDAFHGIARTSDTEQEDTDSARIENGLARLGLDPPPPPTAQAIDLANAETFRLAEDRFAVRKVWQTAIAPRKEGRFLRPVRTLAAPAKIVRIRFSALLGDSDTGVRASIRRWTQVRRLRHIAEAIVDGMTDLLDIEADFSRHQLRIGHSGKSIHVSLPGAAEEIQACLIRSLAEFYDLFDNPRYLLHSSQGWYAVPVLFAAKKANATVFSQRVRRAIGRHRLIFAHGPLGTDAQIAALQAGLLQHGKFRTRSCVRWEAQEPSTATH